ncbi:hypothetical protein N9M16_09770, partial [Candidatus Dependentiae bacterium]|nr:hypothetical protein [Candidatus Dependentiae bacterium]
MGTGVSPLSQRPMASSAPSMTSSKSHQHASAAKPSDKPSTTDANPSGVPAAVDRGGYGGYGGGGGGATLVANPRPSSSSSGPSGGTNRCAPCPNIGGGDSRLGRASFMSPDAACDALRCVSCDFDVVSFDGVAWARGEGGAGFGALGFWCIMTMKLASVTPAPVSVTSSVSTLPLWIRTISGAGIFCVSESFARTSPMVEASSKSSSNFWLVLVTRNEAWER